MSAPLMIGNWKMNKRQGEASELAGRISAFISQHQLTPEVVLCPPVLWLQELVKNYKVKGLAFGAQDCHWQETGAFTGDISAPMIRDAGADYVIVGHSERRQHHGETDDIVRRKAEAAIAAGLKVVLCIGETLEEHKADKTEEVLDRQLRLSLPDAFHASRLIVAYEPVWAIGTGISADINQIAHAHAMIRDYLENAHEKANFRILYGGSVKPDNIVPILSLENVDGVLVGSASINADDFTAMILEAGEVKKK